MLVLAQIAEYRFDSDGNNVGRRSGPRKVACTVCEKLVEPGAHMESHMNRFHRSLEDWVTGLITAPASVPAGSGGATKMTETQETAALPSSEIAMTEVEETLTSLSVQAAMEGAEGKEE